MKTDDRNGFLLPSFYLSEILLALEHLHKEGIIYRGMNERHRCGFEVD